MGFRTNSYAKVWSVTPVSETKTKLRISVSRKDKQTGEYTQDFSGFVDCVGSAAARKAAGLREGDRIKLGDIDVTTRYDKEKNITYTNYTVFSFDAEQGFNNNTPATTEPQPIVDEGDPDENALPF